MIWNYDNRPVTVSFVFFRPQLPSNMTETEKVWWNSSDSDEAPEEVNLKVSKRIYDQSKQTALDLEKDARRKRKQRNKQLNTAYKAQKVAVKDLFKNQQLYCICMIS